MSETLDDIQSRIAALEAALREIANIPNPDADKTLAGVIAIATKAISRR